VTDRLRPRPPVDDAAGSGWSRRLAVRLAVRDAAFWRRSDVGALLQSLLQWLTDDVWELECLPGRRQHRFAESQLPLFSDRPRLGTRFGLFSGGLDSFLGAARDLDPARELVLVSATTSPAMGALQARTISALRASGSRNLRSLIVPVGLRTDAIRALTGGREAPEPSQRTRGLVFLILGAVSAVSGGAAELRVYENGIGAMNLPLTEAQYGAHNTRAMHPETLVTAEALISLVAERDFTIVNPSFAFTKAQMCAVVPDQLRAAVSETVSCDTGLTHRASRTRLCGMCTSCLLRRQAMRAGGLRDRDDAETASYRVDARHVRDPSDQALRRLHYMLGQAAQFERALASPEPHRALGLAFPDLRRVWAALHRQGQHRPEALTSALLARYCEEWRTFDHPLTGRYLVTAAPAATAAA
jgi:hypothetical protein